MNTRDLTPEEAAQQLAAARAQAAEQLGRRKAVLAAIGADACSVRALGQRVHLPAGELSDTLGRLEAGGFLLVDELNRVRLTEAGRQVVGLERLVRQDGETHREGGRA